jgi:hypothetical protein
LSFLNWYKRAASEINGYYLLSTVLLLKNGSSTGGACLFHAPSKLFALLQVELSVLDFAEQL